MDKLLLIFLLFITYQGFSQARLDKSIAFDSDPEKKYSVYLPKNYLDGPQTVILALHPYNKARWDSESWCDRLVPFAEANGLVLLAPDGGKDGKIDDPIDTAFTSHLLANFSREFDVQIKSVYALGFSWGGKTAYTYSLHHPTKVDGAIVLGAVISPENDMSDLWSSADRFPFYILHGTEDQPEKRMEWIRDSLTAYGAYVKAVLLQDVGHTVDFDGVEGQLKLAYQWVDSLHTLLSDSTFIKDQSKPEGLLSTIPEIIKGGGELPVRFNMLAPGNMKYEILNISGEVINSKEVSWGRGAHGININLSDLPWGVYYVRFQSPAFDQKFKVIIRG